MQLIREITEIRKKQYPASKLLTTTKVADMYDIDSHTAAELIKKCGGRKVGNKWVITEEELERGVRK